MKGGIGILKKYICILIIIFLIPSTSFANTFDIKDIANQIKIEDNEFLANVDIEEMLDNLQKGEFSFDFKKIYTSIGSFLFKEIKSCFPLMIQIIAIAILGALLKNLQENMGSGGTAEIGFYVTYILIITLVVSSFVQAVDIAKDTVNTLMNFMQALLPILISLMVATGGVVSSSAIYPVIIIATQTISNLVVNFIIPMVLLAFTIGIVGNISEKINVKGISKGLKSISIWILGAILTIFVGIMSIEGTMASSVDGITVKTAKFMFSNGIPVVGKILGDSVDTILGSSLILKNAVGMVGVIVIFLLGISPLLKIFAVILMYTLTAAIIEPFTEKRIVVCINDTGGALKILLGCVLGVEVMFLISVVTMMKMANMSMMLR